MRSARLLAVVLLATALLPAEAGSKEGVRAYLDAPVRLNAAPGTVVRVAWKLRDEKGNLFGGGGIYLRVSRCGRRPLRVRAQERYAGSYVARVRTPKGGIRKLMVGLPGWRIMNGKTTRADAYFQFNPPLYRRCPS